VTRLLDQKSSALTAVAVSAASQHHICHYVKLSFPATTRARSAVGPSLSLTQRSGTHCQTSSATHRYRLTVSVASLKHSCLQTRISVHSALQFVVDALFKSTFTYLHCISVLRTSTQHCVVVASSFKSKLLVMFSLCLSVSLSVFFGRISQKVVDQFSEISGGVRL